MYPPTKVFIFTSALPLADFRLLLVNQGGSQGQLAGRLRALGNGLATLVQGLGSVYRDTAIVVMSEFGRTVHENGDGGTDHGHGNVIWILGGGIKGGKVYGE